MPEESSWGTAGFLVPRLSSSTRISFAFSGDALSVLFDEGQVVLDAKADGLEGWWTAGLVLPLRPRAATTFVCHFRTFVQKTASTRALITVNIGGQLATRDFGYGTEAKDDFVTEVKFDASALTAGRVVIVVMVNAERQSLDDRVTIALDSLDAFTVAPEETQTKV